MEPAQTTQAKTPQPAVARRLFEQACELSGGIMTTRVDGYSIERARYNGQPVLAATLMLGHGVSMRVCLSPGLAADFVSDGSKLLSMRGPHAGYQREEVSK